MSEKFIYRPEDLTFSRELGTNGDNQLAHEIANQISETWNFTSKPPENPTLIMLGGLQGSGKSSTIYLS
jgi:polynucleotide 5'-kinase involved in rRNA processing